MSFKPRLTKPENNNPYYNIATYGGYSKCIQGNTCKSCYTKKLSVLPNCVGWGWGRFNEIIGENCFRYYVQGNAEDLYLRAISLGLKVGKEPKVGALICWAKGKVGKSGDGCGHVAVVEQRLDKNTIVVSQSGWSTNKTFWTATHKKGSKGNWVEGDDYSWMKSGYIFQGFIYNPKIEEKNSWGACPYNTPTKAIKRGAKGNNVKWLQWQLCRLGWDVDVDGSFGPKTETSLKILQTKFGLSSDGSCGPLTRNAILNK